MIPRKELSIMAISIPALREEGDGRCLLQRRRWRLFLSPPSARRATDAGIDYTRLSWISIPALREEGDGCGRSAQV